jgi:hypothetical protein
MVAIKWRKNIATTKHTTTATTEYTTASKFEKSR